MQGEQSRCLQRAGVRPGECMSREPREAVFRKDGVATWQKAARGLKAGVKIVFLDIVMLRSLVTSAKLPEWDSRRESQVAFAEESREA